MQVDSLYGAGHTVGLHSFPFSWGSFAGKVICSWESWGSGVQDGLGAVQSTGRAVFLPVSRLGGHIGAWGVTAKAWGLRPFGGRTCSCPHHAHSSVLSLFLETLEVTGGGSQGAEVLLHRCLSLWQPHVGSGTSVLGLEALGCHLSPQDLF